MPADSVEVFERLLGNVGGQGDVWWCSSGCFGCLGGEKSVYLDVEIDRASERSSEADIIPSPAFERVRLMFCCRIDSFKCRVNDPSEGVVSRHCLARPGHAELVVAEAVGSRAPGARGEHARVR